MMDSFQFELVSPEKLLFSGAVTSVIVPGSEGDFEVLAHHMPVMSTLRPGVLHIREDAGSSRRIFVRGGFAEVSGQGLTILAEQILPMEDLTADQLEAEIALAEAGVQSAAGDLARADAAQRVGQLRDLQRGLAL